MRRPILRADARAACLAFATLASYPAAAQANEIAKACVEACAAATADHLGRGVALAANGELDRAIAEYDAALALDPGSTAAVYSRANAFRLRYQRARSLATEGGDETSDQERALADYTRAIELKPELAAAYVNRAIVWYERGEFERAIADCDIAIGLAADLAEAWNNRSLAWYRSGHYEKAKADFDQTIKLEQHYGNAMIMRAVGDTLAASD